MKDFAVLGDHRVKLKESEKKDEYKDFARQQKKKKKHESDNYTNCNWCARYSQQRIDKGTRGLGNKRTPSKMTALFRLARTLKRVPET